jgi:transglutaminase-like putative cysteine protease
VKFASLHALVSYLLAGVGFLALSLGDELGLGSRVVFGVGWLGSLAVSDERRLRPRYQAAWNFLLLAYLATALLRVLFLGEGMLALGLELAGVLQVIKLFQRRFAKDHQQIQVLAFLHLIAATILSTGLEYALVFFAYVLLVPWMFALTHLRTEIEAHYATEAAGDEGRRAVDKVLASRRIAGWRFLFATASLAIPLFLATAAFFLLFPRVGMGFLSFGDGAGRQMAGFSGEVELGGFGVIRTDPTVVLRVLPDRDDPDETASARANTQRSFRLRGTSFDRYEDARWSRTPERPRRVTPQLGTFSLQRQSRGREARLQIVLDAIEPPVLFFPIGTVGLELPPRVEGGIDVQRQLVRGRGLDVRYLDGDGLQQRYTAIYEPDRPFDVEELTPEERALYVQVPRDLSPRVRALAVRVAGEGDDSTRARRVEAWLRDSGELAYSLEQPDTSGRDPLDVFLFEARRGHCEYFSTALAVLLRSIDIPARNVTGFVGGTFNPYGDYYAIRQGDAHSWVEAHVDGRWETFDPTPPARGEVAPADTGFFASLDALVDALRTSWDDDVVGYDLRRQVEGLRDAFRWFRRLRGSADDEERRGSSEAEGAPGRRIPWVGGVIVAALVLGLAWLLRTAWRRRRPVAETHPAAKLYRVLDRKLTKLGRPRPPGRTPREHADTLRAEGYPGSGVVDEVTEAYLASRWGEVPLDVRRFRARIRDLPKPSRGA